MVEKPPVPLAAAVRPGQRNLAATPRPSATECPWGTLINRSGPWQDRHQCDFTVLLFEPFLDRRVSEIHLACRLHQLSRCGRTGYSPLSVETHMSSHLVMGNIDGPAGQHRRIRASSSTPPARQGTTNCSRSPRRVLQHLALRRCTAPGDQGSLVEPALRPRTADQVPAAQTRRLVRIRQAGKPARKPRGRPENRDRSAHQGRLRAGAPRVRVLSPGLCAAPGSHRQGAEGSADPASAAGHEVQSGEAGRSVVTDCDVPVGDAFSVDVPGVDHSAGVG